PGIHHAKQICNAAFGMTSVHKQQITISNPRREIPIHAIGSIHPLPLILDSRLYPDLKRDAEMSLEFDHLNATWDCRAIVMPAHDVVALTWIVAVHFEIPRAKFKFNPDSSLRIADMLISDAIGIPGSDFFNSKL